MRIDAEILIRSTWVNKFFASFYPQVQEIPDKYMLELQEDNRDEASIAEQDQSCLLGFYIWAVFLVVLLTAPIHYLCA